MKSAQSFCLATATALAAFGAQATEALQWNPDGDAALQAATNEATLAPMAWTVGRGEATQFRDAVARDAMASRPSVRQDLLQARSRHLLADTGEAGATERVLARRAALAQSQHDRELARDTTLQASADPIGVLAATVAMR